MRQTARGECGLTLTPRNYPIQQVIVEILQVSPERRLNIVLQGVHEVAPVNLQLLVNFRVYLYLTRKAWISGYDMFCRISGLGMSTIMQKSLARYRFF